MFLGWQMEEEIKFFKMAISELESVGYVLDYRICDVAEYGVPQHRKRLIVLGGGR